MYKMSMVVVSAAAAAADDDGMINSTEYRKLESFTGTGSVVVVVVSAAAAAVADDDDGMINSSRSWSGLAQFQHGVDGGNKLGMTPAMIIHF